MVAALALRLAEIGCARSVSVQVAGTRQAFEAVRSFLDEWRENGSRPAGVTSVSSVSVREACAGILAMGTEVLEDHPGTTVFGATCGAAS
jgi:hypothetical protein